MAGSSSSTHFRGCILPLGPSSRANSAKSIPQRHQGIPRRGPEQQRLHRRNGYARRWQPVFGPAGADPRALAQVSPHCLTHTGAISAGPMACISPACRHVPSWSGRPGRLPTQAPHRSGRAGFPHPALRIKDSLRIGRSSGPLSGEAASSGEEVARTGASRNTLVANAAPATSSRSAGPPHRTDEATHSCP